MQRSDRQFGDDSSAEALTPRQRDVTALIAEGLTNHEIADALGVRPALVAVEVAKIMAILGALSRLQVAVWFWNQER